MGEITGLLAVIMVFSIPLAGILTAHRRQVLEMQLKLRQQGNSNVEGQIEALRQELRELRDTTMQYDLSFDTALQRMERRVEHIEQQQQQQRVGM